MKKLTSLFLISFILLQGCSTTSQKSSISSAPSVQEATSNESLLGEKIHEQILSQFYLYTDPMVLDYVQKVTTSLAQHAERQEFPYKVTILYHDKIYATSAPGGFIYLTTAMLNFIDSEAQLAAVVGHEIGELQHRDYRLSPTHQTLDTLMRAGGTVAPAFGQIGMLALLGLALVNTATDASMPSEKDKLLQADHLALSYMVEEKYDPQGLLDFFYKFLDAETKLMPTFYEYYQSRPINHERFMQAQKDFSELALPEGRYETSFETYQKYTKGVREIYAR